METLRRGLSNIFVAEITADDSASFTTGTPEQLFPAGEMTRSVDSEKTEVYYDNNVFYTSGKEGKTTVSITGADIRVSKLARLLGKYVDPTTGAVLDTGEYKEKYYALGGTAHKVDGTEEKFWLLKGTFDIPELADKTIDDSTDTSGMTMNFNAVRTKHKFTVGSDSKGMKQVSIDTETTAVKTAHTWEAQVVTPDNLTTICEAVAQTVATPTFSPATGQTFEDTLSVTLACATAGATIHYTTDGTTPTDASPTYSTAISLSATTTVKAIAMKSGMTDSAVSTATYTKS